MSAIKNASGAYKVPEHIVNKIAESALSSGIILIGGPVACGKTNTVNFFLESIDNNATFKPNLIVNIDSRRMLAAGESVNAFVDALLLEHDGKHLLVIIDDIYEPNAIQAAIVLADNKHSVIGIVESSPRQGTLWVLEGLLSGTIDSEKNLITKQVIERLNLLIEQPSSNMFEYGYFSLPLSIKKMLILALDMHGYDYLFNENVESILRADRQTKVRNHEDF